MDNTTLDNLYLAAVAREDWAAADKIVLAAAQDAGFTTVAFHAGTVGNKFSHQYTGTGLVGKRSTYVFFGDDAHGVKFYAEPESGRHVRRYFLKTAGFQEFDGGPPRGNADDATVSAFHEGREFSGAVTRQVVDGDTTMDVFTLPFNDSGSISLAKFADTVIYDDAGEIVPPSKRFGCDSDDLRMGFDPAADKNDEAVRLPPDNWNVAPPNSEQPADAPAPSAG